MDKIIPHCCPRCNSKKLYKYGKDKFGNQKYQCRVCKHQFAPDVISMVLVYKCGQEKSNNLYY